MPLAAAVVGVAERLVQFIAEKFNGKRRDQLSDEELSLLICYLQSVDDGG